MSLFMVIDTGKICESMLAKFKPLTSGFYRSGMKQCQLCSVSNSCDLL